MGFLEEATETTSSSFHHSTNPDMACAAVASTRASCIKPRESAVVAVVPHTLSQLTNKKETSQAGSSVQKQPCVQVRSTTSESSGKQSKDDGADGETTENMDPADTKRPRRMLSNRKSGRRSRSRKQAQISELETQASQLRVENTTLGILLADISQKYDEAAVDNRVLKADVETLRAKVKMAEETVKRITGLNPFMQFTSEGYTAHPNNRMSPHDLRIQSGLVDMSSAIGNIRNPAAAVITEKTVQGAASSQHVASLEHLRKHIGG